MDTRVERRRLDEIGNEERAALGRWRQRAVDLQQLRDRTDGLEPQLAGGPELQALPGTALCKDCVSAEHDRAAQRAFQWNREDGLRPLRKPGGHSRVHQNQ